MNQSQLSRIDASTSNPVKPIKRMNTIQSNTLPDKPLHINAIPSKQTNAINPFNQYNKTQIDESIQSHAISTNQSDQYINAMMETNGIH